MGLAQVPADAMASKEAGGGGGRAAAAPAAEEGDGRYPLRARSSCSIDSSSSLWAARAPRARLHDLLSYNRPDLPGACWRARSPDAIVREQGDLPPLSSADGGLEEEGKVRMLVRVKPDGSGPLGDMCGCC